MGKERQWQQTLWELTRRYGKPSFEDAVIPTGYRALDDALGAGGIMQHRITDLRGTPTSGATTLALSIMAHASVVVYLDVNASFDPDYAARCGVLLERALIIRPQHPGQTLDIVRDLVNSTDLIIIDTVGKIGLERIPSLATALRRVHEAVSKARAAIVFLRPAASKAQLEPYPHVCLQVEWLAWLHRGSDVCGYQVQVIVQKDKQRPGERRVVLEMQLDAGVEGL